MNGSATVKGTATDANTLKGISVDVNWDTKFAKVEKAILCRRFVNIRWTGPELYGQGLI